MSNYRTHPTRMRIAVMALLGASLAACGGGGGGGGTAPEPALIDLTTANMTTVARAAAAAPFAFGVTGVVPVLGTAQGSMVIRPGAGATSQVLATALPALRSGPTAGRAQALAYWPGDPQACPLGGTLTVDIDDADSDGLFDAGDTMTFTFAQCRTADETTHGAASLTLTRVDGGPLLAFGARLTMTGLSTSWSDGRHAFISDGTAWMDYAALAADGWGHTVRERLTMTAENTVRVRVQQRHEGLEDTVGILDGYTYESVSDATQAMTTTTFQGAFHSAAAGGTARARTENAFQDHHVDPYPWTGTMRVNGQHGTMLVRAMSTEQVRLELDHNDCGAAEETRTESWDWLM